MKKLIKTLVVTLGFLSPILLTSCGEAYKGLEGEDLRVAIQKDISTNKFISYRDAAGHMRKIDADPETKGNIFLFYTGDSFELGGLLTPFQDGTLNKEHVWCQSRFRAYSQTPGKNDFEEIKVPTPYSDLYNIRPSYESVNVVRSNYLYKENSKMNATDNESWNPFDPKYVPSSFNMTYESYGKTVHASYSGNGGDETYRGEIARILFYDATRYEKLKLADNNDPNANFSTSGASNTMGDLSTLLEWNLKYPVTEREKLRNDVIESIQGNRNPFVDNNSYACRIWGRTNASTKKACGLE